jgi:hypothetical protein
MSKVKTPFGEIETDLSKYPTWKPTGAAATFDAKGFFFLAPAKAIKNSPLLSKAFSDTYGPKALAILRKFGTFPVYHDAKLVSTAEQQQYFNDDGSRSHYSVVELLAMSEADLAKAGYSAVLINTILTDYVYRWYFPDSVPNS